MARRPARRCLPAIRGIATGDSATAGCLAFPVSFLQHGHESQHPQAIAGRVCDWSPNNTPPVPWDIPAQTIAQGHGRCVRRLQKACAAYHGIFCAWGLPNAARHHRLINHGSGQSVWIGREGLEEDHGGWIPSLIMPCLAKHGAQTTRSHRDALALGQISADRTRGAFAPRVSLPIRPLGLTLNRPFHVADASPAATTRGYNLPYRIGPREDPPTAPWRQRRSGASRRRPEPWRADDTAGSGLTSSTSARGIGPASFPQPVARRQCSQASLANPVPQRGQRPAARRSGYRQTGQHATGLPDRCSILLATLGRGPSLLSHPKPHGPGYFLGLAIHFPHYARECLRCQAGH